MKKDRERISLTWIILLSLLLAMMLNGCGRKGDPQPRQQAMLKPISDLKVERIDRGVLLTWSLRMPQTGKIFFRLLRTDPLTLKEECPKCPRSFNVLTEKDESSVERIPNEQDRYRYLDRTVQTGCYYGYRIVYGISSGPVSSDSNTAEIQIN